MPIFFDYISKARKNPPEYAKRTQCKLLSLIHIFALRAVTTDDFMTADWARIPFDVLAKVSNRITNEVKGVNRVVYDVTTKPPATVEWE